MAVRKEYLYPPLTQTTAAIFRAIAHSARLQILEQLETKGPLCVKEIQEVHPISKEALSDHLKILRTAQLVEWYERYPYTFYEVHETNLAIAKELALNFFAAFNFNTVKENQEKPAH